MVTSSSAPYWSRKSSRVLFMARTMARSSSAPERGVGIWLLYPFHDPERSRPHAVDLVLFTGKVARQPLQLHPVARHLRDDRVPISPPQQRAGDHWATSVMVTSPIFSSTTPGEPS